MSMATYRCADPGAGARLGGEARAELTAAVRDWQRTAPAVAVLEVQGDAWAADPERLDHREITRAHALVTALRARDFPVVVSVEGAVSGLGTALLLAADARFGSGEASVGAGDSPASALLAGAGLPDPLAAIVDRLAWTGERLDVDAGVSAGLFTARGSAQDARACAERLAGDPGGWAAVKRAARTRSRATPDEALRYRAWLLDTVLNG
jgi:enoyl-CoA hydratase/carnithine racemase